MVRGRKETDPPPPFHRAQGLAALNHNVMEGIGRNAGGTPRAPLVEWLWGEKATEAVLAFLRDTRVGCTSTRRELPEEECDEDGSNGEGGEGVPGPP